MTSRSRDNLFSVIWYSGLVGILLMLAAALIACVSIPLGHADGLPTKSKIWSPLNTLEPTLGWKAHNFYIGAVGGYSAYPNPARSSDEYKPEFSFGGGPLADEWQLGLLAGYLYRSGPTGWAGGVEVDWTPHALSRLRDDDGAMTLRARAGAFVSSKTFVYGTFGAHLDMDVLTGLVMQGPVVGGGMEYDITSNLTLRAEVLHLRYGADYVDWGDEGATQLRLGALVKF